MKVLAFPIRCLDTPSWKTVKTADRVDFDEFDGIRNSNWKCRILSPLPKRKRLFCVRLRETRPFVERSSRKAEAREGGHRKAVEAEVKVREVHSHSFLLIQGGREGGREGGRGREREGGERIRILCPPRGGERMSPKNHSVSATCASSAGNFHFCHLCRRRGGGVKASIFLGRCGTVWRNV